MDAMTRVMLVLMATLALPVGLAWGGIGSGGGGVTTVSLRSTVRLATDQALTLGSIAIINGDQAAALASLPVGDDDAAVAVGSWTTIDADAVRATIGLSAARDGSVVVVGARSSVTRMNDMPPRNQAPTNTASESTGTVTVRDHLASWLAARLGVGGDRLRARFDERDADVLGLPTAGRVVEVRQIGASSRMALRVTVYEQDTIVLTESLRVAVEVLADAPIAVTPLRRGSRLEAAMYELSQVWSDPTDPPADPALAVGQVLRRAVAPGEVIRLAALESPALVHRGQDVSVRTVRGSVVVTTIARARHDAGQGEIVELESKDRSDRRFTARVAGPGRAVMIDPQEVTP
jgi:flagella basal body P-ring formation protein FlgA